MGGTKLDPAEIIRTLVDRGKIEEKVGPLPAPWDGFVGVLLAAGRSRAKRIEALFSLINKLPNKAEIVWRINQADFLTEPPFPYSEYPELWQEDLPIRNVVHFESQPDLPSQFLRENGHTQERKPHREKLKEGETEYRGLIFSYDGKSTKLSSGGKEISPSPSEEKSIKDYLQFARKEGLNPMEVAENIMSGNGDGVKKRGQWFNACEVFQPIPPTEWLVEGLISKGSVSLIVGEGGSKKTYSMIDLAICLAMGKPWLDFPTIQAGVLWVDEESGVARMKRRLKQAMNAHQAPPETPVDCVCMANFNLRKPEDVNQLFAEVWEREVGLVVIDALADVMPGGDENAVRDVVPVFQGLRKIAEFTGAAVVLIHHANKSGGYRGSSHMRGAVELMLMAQSKEISTFIDFQSIKTRDTPSLHFAAQIHFELDDPETERVWLTSASSSDAQRANRSGGLIGSAGRYVLGFLSENGESTMNEIKENAEGCTDKAARQALYDLVKQGLVKRTNEGGKGTVALYDLTDKSDEYV